MTTELPVNQIICGNSLEELPKLPAESVNCVITSPPYWGLRDYGIEPSVWGGKPECEHQWSAADRMGGGKQDEKGKRWQHTGGGTSGHGRARSTFCQLCGAWRGCYGLEPTIDLYVEHTVMIFREVRRLLTRDGTLWLNLGDSHASGKGSCFNPGGGETRYKDYRKEAGVIRLRRLNLSEVRDQGLKPKDLCGIPWRVAFALQADGWWVRSDIIWHKPNPMPESVTDRCTKAHEYIFMLAKSADYYFDAEAIKEQQSEATFERFGNGKAARKVTVKAFASEPGQVLSNSDYKTKCPDAIMPDGKRNKRSVWTIPTQGTKDAHFATFPPKLIEPMILAGCPKEVCVACGKPRERIVEKIKRFESGSGRNGNPIGGKHGSKSQGGGDAGDIRKGPCVHAQTVNWSDCGCGRGFRPGVVLDPFAGTGTIGQVAAKLKRDYLLIEIKQEYVDQIARYKLDEVEIALPVKKARKGQKALFENI